MIYYRNNVVTFFSFPAFEAGLRRSFCSEMSAYLTRLRRTEKYAARRLLKAQRIELARSAFIVIFFEKSRATMLWNYMKWRLPRGCHLP